MAPTKNRRFEGKLALVTGAAGGIGLETALALARAGADLALCDVNEAGLEAAAGRVEAEGRAGVRVLARRVDVADRAAVSALADEVHARLGVLDVLVNNAGVALAGGFLDTTLEDWDWILGINLLTTVTKERSGISHQRRGRIRRRIRAPGTT